MTGTKNGPERACWGVLVTALLFAVPTSGATIRLNGSSTVVKDVVDPHREAVEMATGHTLNVVGNGTGKGLADLFAGRCDGAMTSVPLDVAVTAAGLAGAVVDVTRLQLHTLDHEEVVFVVNAANPVQSLTWLQLSDIHTGKVKNWSLVGGPNQPITVYTDTLTGGIRSLVKGTVMDGQEYLPSAVVLTSVGKVAQLIGFDTTGVGAISKGFLDPRTRVIATDPIESPLALITLGPPSPALRSLIAAFKTEIEKP